jgi:hypothetical protein
MQIYVASIRLLYNVQYIDDSKNNNNTMSQELDKIFQAARTLLCDIEDFINATSSQKIGKKDWIKMKEMKQILQFKNFTEMELHRTYVKGRFQSYIQKLYRRIVQQSERTDWTEKRISYPKHKSLRRKHNKSPNRLNKGERRGKKRQNKNSFDNNEASSVTKRIHIVRTTKMPNNAQQVTRQSRKNRPHQRVSRTSTISTTTAPAVRP